VIVVACHPDIQIQRLMDRDGLTLADAHRRIGAQLPIEDKTRLADWVIRTDGTFGDTNTQVRATWERLRTLHAPLADESS